MDDQSLCIISYTNVEKNTRKQVTAAWESDKRNIKPHPNMKQSSVLDFSISGEKKDHIDSRDNVQVIYREYYWREMKLKKINIILSYK